MPGELPPLPLRLSRHETAPQEAVTEQLGDPFSILHIRFAPRHRLDVLGIDHQEDKQALRGALFMQSLCCVLP
jgi:hypothetical protein